MASPIFFSMFKKKYVVQIRAGQRAWQEHKSYRSIEEAERIIRRLIKDRPSLEAIRIIDRFTNEVVRSYKP